MNPPNTPVWPPVPGAFQVKIWQDPFHDPRAVLGTVVQLQWACIVFLP